MGSPYRVISAQPITTVDEFAITEDDVLVDGNGLPMASWSNTGTVVNKIDVQYNFNEAERPNDFAKRSIYTAEQSVERYTAQPPLLAECRGIHDELDGQAILDRFALLYLQRWGYPPPILIFSVTYRRHVFEAMDVIHVTHSKIPNPITGTMGLTNARMEILNVSPRWGLSGRLELTAVWIGAIETSAVPVLGTSSLVAGESTVDSTDTNIPFGASITLTTPGDPCTEINIGLKGLSYRTWRCSWTDFVPNQPAKDTPPTCISEAGTFYDERIYGTMVTYRMEYKHSTAPDAPGGGNPALGWVELLPATDRGNTSLISVASCNILAAAPAEDMWSHHFGSGDLVGVPKVFNVKITFDSVTTHANPCPAGHVNCANGCASVFAGSLLNVDQVRLTADYIEAIV